MSAGDGGSPVVASNTRLPKTGRDQGQLSGGSARPARVEPLVWLAAEICGITPLEALIEQKRPGPLARHMVTAWLIDYQGWRPSQVAAVLGREASTIRKNHSNFKRKLKGPNGPAPFYAIFQRRAALL